MESVNRGLRSFAKDATASANRSSSNGASFSGSDFASEQAQLVVRRSSSQMVSVSTCTKLCAVGFLVGVVVGYTLKRRVRRWASKILKRLKDD